MKWIVFVGVVAALAALPYSAPVMAAKPSLPPVLSGESFAGTPTFMNVLCNPDGTSSFDYSVTGIASGPYAGPYSERGHVTVFGQTVRSEIDLGGGAVVEFETGVTTALEATFWIDSPTGLVTGTKSLAFPGPGACQDTVALNSIVGTIPAQLRATEADASYTATIQVGRRAYCDRGMSEQLTRVFAVGYPIDQEIVPIQFVATFGPALNSVEALHGKKDC